MILSFQPVLDQLMADLNRWLNVTKDPWICSPHAVLEDIGGVEHQPSCRPLFNQAKSLNEL